MCRFQLPRDHHSATGRPFAVLLFLLLGVVLLFPGAPALATFPSMPDVPVDRLVKNTEAYAKAHPDDPDGHYTLGRIHHFGFEYDTKTLVASDFDKDALPQVDDRFNHPPKPAKPAPPTDSQKAHLLAAARGYRRAIDLARPNDATSGRYHLALGCLLDVGATAAVEIGLAPADVDAKAPTADEADAKRLRALVDDLDAGDDAARAEAARRLRDAGAKAVPLLLDRLKELPPDAERAVRGRREQLAGVVARYWKDRAVDAYWTAYERTIDADLKAKANPTHGFDRVVAYEAGRNYARLVNERGPTADEKKRLARVAADLEKMEEFPAGPVTPIVFSFRGQDRRLADLLAPADPARRVRFDLDGLGRGRSWPWVKPTTALLAWDPSGAGRVTSGRQLFGSVTFFLFWENGYRALAALDDDGDGELTGPELAGLAAWFDRDGDGVAGPGEVVPLERLGVEAVSARATGEDAGSPCNPGGLRLHDGRLVATFDWVVERPPAPAK